jgi:hypothetical protein
LRDGQALDSFGRAAPEVTDAYITWALTEAGFFDFEPEIKKQSERAAGSKDEYVLALAAGTMLNIPARKGEGIAAAKRLSELQGKDGAWTRADHSITRSTGTNLHIETTALALLALMKAGGHEGAIRKGVEWLTNNRGGYGQWGATQATVLALKAMAEYATRSRQTQSGGTISVRVNGKEVTKIIYQAGHRDPIIVDGIGHHFTAGKNQVELISSGKDELPYSMALDYRSLKPANHPDVVVDLETKLAATTVQMGENVRLTATIKNKTDAGQPMTLARIGLPGGLTFQNWQLKELREKGEIAFYETRHREVILYFRELKPSETKQIPIDLVATIPGKTTGPASSAYLYYTNDQKVWVDGLAVDIPAPPR